MSRIPRAEAQALLEGYAADAAGGIGRFALASPHVQARAIRAAEKALSRAARRALGARGDGRYDWRASRCATVRTRNAA